MKLKAESRPEQKLSPIECESCFVHFDPEKVWEKLCPSCDYKRNGRTFSRPNQDLKTLAIIVVGFAIVVLGFIIYGAVRYWHTALLN